MLTLPPQGINILSNLPPSANVLDNANQLIYVALNDQILREIQAGIAEGLSVTFGGKNAGLKIGEKVHQFSGIIPESGSSPFEVYCQKGRTKSDLELVGRVTHKIQVRRGLDSSSMERIKSRTEEAERERNSRKAIFLEKPPSSKRSSLLHSRHNSSGTRSFLSAFDNGHVNHGSGVRSLPSSPLLRPTSGTTNPKCLPMGGSPRLAPLSSPRLNPSSPQPPMNSLRVRLIHILALGHSTEQTLQEKTRALRTELSTCLQEVARKIATGSSLWELKDECYRELKPKEWKNYTTKERGLVEKKQSEVLARLPPPKAVSDDTLNPSEIPKKQVSNKVRDDHQSLATTPVHVGSPAVRPSSTMSTKRPAEDEMINPTSKAGKTVGSTKNGSTRVIGQVVSGSNSPPEKKSLSRTTQRKASPSRKKESRKVKSEEKIMDSDSNSDSDIPLEKHMEASTVRKAPAKSERSTAGLKGLGITAVVSEPKRAAHVASPSGSNTNRSRTSSSSSTTSYSPPKKRSPLATNEPLTAQRAKPLKAASPSHSGKKRSREVENSKPDKRPKLQPATDKSMSHLASVAERHVEDSPKRTPGHSHEIISKRIEQQHHDIADQFRKLYPEYQELHHRLQSLDADGLALEKGNVARLYKMQEQLGEWKAVLWKAAGDSRRVTTAKMPRGMMGVRV